MNNKKKISQNGPIQAWGEKINWSKRAKAVCKPCWEIKYCPYGPLVEDFPLKEERDEKSCRIFGHDCPVFYVAEPLTETKELRNISRSIPRKVQFRVLKRDNQICSSCKNSVLDEEVEFDHIIPWSKGGPSEEYNIKLLCKRCNRKKGNNFEETYLIDSLAEHIQAPILFKFVKTIFQIMSFIWKKYDLTKMNLTPENFCAVWGRRKAEEHDKQGAQTFNEIKQFFVSPKPQELSVQEFEALKYRWGFINKKFQTISQTSNFIKLESVRIFELDKLFIERMGFFVKLNEKDKKAWLKT